MILDAATFNLITLIWGILTLVLTVVYIIMTVIKKRKSKHLDKKTDAVTEDTNKTLEKVTAFNKIYDRIQGYMQAAEVGNQVLKNLADRSGIPIHTGVQKLTEVLSKIKIDCMTEGVEYDEKYWKEKIEELIKFSKVVNAK